MDKTKKIKFEFQDDGSLDKLKANYEKFANELAGKAKNFGGNNTASQAKYIKDEVKYYKELYDIQQKVFEQKKASYEALEARRKSVEASYQAGNIRTDTYQNHLDDIKSQTKGLLKGTGRRTWNTYEKATTSSLNQTGGNVSRLEKLMESSNFILREILGQDREDALKTVQAIEKDKEASPEERMAASMARERLDAKAPQEQNTKGILESLFSFQNLNNLLSRATGTLTASSGLDATKNLSSAAKEAGIAVADIGADLLGNYIGDETASAAKKATKAGVVAAIKAGARITGAMWDVFSDDKFEAFESRNELDLSRFRNRGLTGKDLSVGSLSSMGYSLTDVSNANNAIARSMGTGFGSENQTMNALKLDRGFGIDQSVSQSLLELTRSNKETDKNLISIVGGIYSSGKQIFNGDRTFLGEFITKNFTGLQRELLRNQASVRSGTVMDVLARFDRVGGQWDAKNPNSMGLISSVNNSLMNPNGDTMDALTFTALRKSMPGAGILDILKEREKGVGSSKYLDSVFGQLDQLGGNKDMQVINLAKAFGINYNAADELYSMRKKNPKMFANMSQKELQGVIGGLDGMAESNTTLTQSQAAKLTDAKIQGDWTKMFELINQMGDIIKASFDGAKYTIDPATKVLNVAHPSSTTTRTPPTNSNARPSVVNVIDALNPVNVAASVIKGLF